MYDNNKLSTTSILGMHR